MTHWTAKFDFLSLCSSCRKPCRFLEGKNCFKTHLSVQVCATTQISPDRTLIIVRESKGDFAKKSKNWNMGNRMLCSSPAPPVRTPWTLRPPCRTGGGTRRACPGPSWSSSSSGGGGWLWLESAREETGEWRGFSFPPMWAVAAMDAKIWRHSKKEEKQEQSMSHL